MEFFDGWKTLNTCFDNGDLTALTQLIGYKIYAIFDEHRFPESLSISDRELMSRTNIKSTRTIVEARRRLKNAGLIDFDSRQGKGTIYRLTMKQSGNSKETVSKQLVNSEETVSVNPINACATPIPLTLISSSSARAREIDEAQEHWKLKKGGRLSFEHLSELQVLIDKYGLDWLKNRMTEASDANGNSYGLSMKFFRAFIKRYLKGGEKVEITTPSYTKPIRTGNEPWANF